MNFPQCIDVVKGIDPLCPLRNAKKIILPPGFGGAIRLAVRQGSGCVIVGDGPVYNLSDGSQVQIAKEHLRAMNPTT